MSDDIEKLARRRRIILATYGMLFIALQPSIFLPLDDPFETWRPVHFALAAGFLGWSGTLIYILATGGLLFRGRSEAARAALNDELTSANRRAAYRSTYWMLLGTIALLYLIQLYKPFDVREVLRLLFAFGVAMPAMVFAGKEKKQGA